MRKVLAFQFMTLDGIAEFPEYENPPPKAPDEIESMWTPHMSGIDTLFLGRVTYEKWAAFWPRQQHDPTANEWMREYSKFCDRVEKIVFSKSFAVADWPRSRIVRGGIVAEVARLREQPGGNLAIGGGPRLLQSFLALDLVDDLYLEVFPSIVGHGKPLFHLELDPNHDPDEIPVGAADRHDFRMVEARAQSDGNLHLHYERASPRT